MLADGRVDCMSSLGDNKTSWTCGKHREERSQTAHRDDGGMPMGVSSLPGVSTTPALITANEMSL